MFTDQALEEWSPNKTAQFLQHVINSTYNYASNARETYLLLQLFRTALKQEITEKVVEAKEFITGNPTVTKLVITHHRGRGTCGYVHACVRMDTCMYVCRIWQVSERHAWASGAATHCR